MQSTTTNSTGLKTTSKITTGPSEIHIYDNQLNDALLDEVYLKIVERGGMAYPFFHVDKPQDLDPTAQAVKKLVREAWFKVIPPKFWPRNGAAGWEVWHNVMYEGDNLDYHCDVDEKASEVVHPHMSCVIYCGPKNRITGGELALDLNSQQDYEFIRYKYNRIVLFSSHLPHQVMPVKYIPDKKQPRVAISCPIWEHEISPNVQAY